MPMQQTSITYAVPQWAKIGKLKDTLFDAKNVDFSGFPKLHFFGF